MANTLGVYNPIFYAQEALIWLRKSLRMGARVHRGFEAERNSFEQGETINIRRPSTFTAANAPATAADITTETVALTLSNWKEVKFKLTDKELAFTGDRIIQDHIGPAAYALADDIDSALMDLYKDVPWHADWGSAASIAGLTTLRQTQFDANVPLSPGMMHMVIDGAAENELLQLAAFSQDQGAGAAGVSTQMSGSLGTKFGYEVAASQNVKTHTKGTCSTSALLVNGSSFAVGDTSIDLDAATVTGTLVAGDTFVIAGNTQRYAVTATSTASGNAFTGVTFTPGLAAAPSDNASVTVELDDHVANLGFHRNAFGLVVAPLPDHGNELGARVATVTDPDSGLSMRSRLYYVGNSSEVHVALDVLYGVKTLDPNLACRGRGA